MKIKSNKGVTLIALVITIVILAIIATVAVLSGVDMSESAKFENVETSLLLIQSKIKVLAEKYVIGEITAADLYGDVVTDGGTYDGWYLLDQDDLYDLGVSDLDKDSGYYVQYVDSNGDVSVDVAYSAGITYNGTTYYKLSDILAAVNN